MYYLMIALFLSLMGSEPKCIETSEAQVTSVAAEGIADEVTITAEYNNEISLVIATKGYDHLNSLGDISVDLDKVQKWIYVDQNGDYQESDENIFNILPKIGSNICGDLVAKGWYVVKDPDYNLDQYDVARLSEKYDPNMWYPIGIGVYWNNTAFAVDKKKKDIFGDCHWYSCSGSCLNYHPTSKAICKGHCTGDWWFGCVCSYNYPLQCFYYAEESAYILN